MIRPQNFLMILLTLSGLAHAGDRSAAISTISSLFPEQRTLLSGTEKSSGLPCQVSVEKTRDAIDMNGGTEESLNIAVFVGNQLRLNFQTSAREVTAVSASPLRRSLKVRAEPTMDLVESPRSTEVVVAFGPRGGLASISLRETQELAFGFGQEGAAYVAVALIFVAASLEAFAGFCLGCRLFALLMRAGVIPESACEACADITRRHAST